MPLIDTLIIPGLAAAVTAAHAAPIPGLRQLCRHARVRAGGVAGMDAAVWAALGGGIDIPGAAAASWTGVHGEAPAQSLLLATPVQMFAGPDQASMVPVPGVGPELQPGLWIRLSQAALECGGRLIAGPEGLVWLRMEEDPGAGGADPFRAAGGPVDLPESQALLRLLNHLQMALHTEQDAGFNSLWFWGAGGAPAITAGAQITLVGGDAAARGMALLRGASVQDRWRDQVPVILIERRLARAADEADWLEALAAIDTELLTPLAARAAPLHIVDPDAGLHLEVVAGWWRRLWNRSGTPGALLGWPGP